MPLLTEVKFEGNLLIGSIPAAFGRARLRRFQVEQNKMSGTIPATFRWEAHDTRFWTQRLGQDGVFGDEAAVPVK
jgi:hypothetical protein